MDIENFFPCVDESVDWIRGKVSAKPSIALVLSGGLDVFVDDMTDRSEISYSEIPHFPAPKAEGHSGKLVFGKYAGTDIVVMQGRFHYYEGHSPYVIVFPYFVLNGLGVQTLITTNAVGGIRKDFKAGDIMMVTDHINAMGMNPLIGIAIQRKTNQFTNMTKAYDEELMKISRKHAKDLNLDLKEGVYLATMGPCYETKAEIIAYRSWGADAVGMSTVPSVIAANFLGMNVLSYSCIANPSADRHGGIMSHREVLDAMNALAPKAVRLLQGVVEEVGRGPVSRP